MLTTNRPKSRFKVRVFDNATKKNLNFTVYETETSLSLEEFVEKLKAAFSSKKRGD